MNYDRIIRGFYKIFTSMQVENNLYSMGFSKPQHRWHYDFEKYIITVHLDGKQSNIILRDKANHEQYLVAIETFSDRMGYNNELSFSDEEGDSRIDVWHIPNAELMQRQTIMVNYMPRSSRTNFFIDEEEEFQMSTVCNIDYPLVRGVYKTVTETVAPYTRVCVGTRLETDDLSEVIEFLDRNNL